MANIQYHLLLIFVFFFFSCFNDENQEAVNQDSEDISQAMDVKSALETYLVDEEENPEKLKELLKANENPNLIFNFQNSNTFGEEMTALMAAIAQNRYRDCDELLKNGADIDKTAGILQETALFLVTSVGSIEQMQYLLERGADPDIPISDDGKTGYCDGSNPLIESIINNEFKKVELLLEYGANPDVAISDNGNNETNDGSPALLIATQIGHLDIVKALLEANADPNKTRSDNGKTASSNGSSPLAIAIIYRHDEIIKLLLSYGANPNSSRSDNGLTKLSDGTTVLMEAILQNQLESVRMLIDAGADINKPRAGDTTDLYDGGFPLYLASEINSLEIVLYLINAGANLNQIRQDSSQMSSLMTAAYHGNFEIVRNLIEAGAKINLLSEKYGTALDNAIDGGHEDIVDYLRQHGAIRSNKN